jgi:tetratricopeptide (TPR) repeat protein
MAQEHRSLVGLPTARRAVLLSAAVLLGGCSLLSSRPSPPNGPSPQTQSSGAQSSRAPSSGPLSPNPPPAPPAQPVPPPPPVRENHLSAATHSLVTQARTQISHGDLDGASTTLDRALRIEPNNPLLWIELGRLRIAEGDAHQAEGCGRKALALASGDRSTQAQAGRLLADALRAQGRNPEALEVERQPFMH